VNYQNFDKKCKFINLQLPTLDVDFGSFLKLFFDKNNVNLSIYDVLWEKLENVNLAENILNNFLNKNNILNYQLPTNYIIKLHKEVSNIKKLMMMSNKNLTALNKSDFMKVLKSLPRPDDGVAEAGEVNVQSTFKLMIKALDNLKMGSNVLSIIFNFKVKYISQEYFGNNNLINYNFNPQEEDPSQSNNKVLATNNITINVNSEFNFYGDGDSSEEPSEEPIPDETPFQEYLENLYLR
jgi:hypothetical protein